MLPLHPLSLSLSLSPSPVLKKTFHFSFPLFFFSSCCCCCCRLVIIGISIVIIINSRYQWRNQSTAIQTTVKSKMKKEKSLKHKQRGWERGRGRELFVSLLAKEKKRKEKDKTKGVEMRAMWAIPFHTLYVRTWCPDQMGGRFSYFGMKENVALLLPTNVTSPRLILDPWRFLNRSVTWSTWLYVAVAVNPILLLSTIYLFVAIRCLLNTSKVAKWLIDAILPILPGHGVRRDIFRNSN